MNAKGMYSFFLIVVLIASIATVHISLSSSTVERALMQRNVSEILITGFQLAEIEHNFDALIYTGLQQDAEDSQQQKTSMLALLETFIHEYQEKGTFYVQSPSKKFEIHTAQELDTLFAIEVIGFEDIKRKRIIFHGGVENQELIFEFTNGKTTTRFKVPKGYTQSLEMVKGYAIS